MKAHTGTRIFAAAAATLLAAACISAIALGGRAPQQPKLPRKYLSEVKDLEVEKAVVEGRGEQARLVVTVRNKSDLAVTAFTLTVGDLHVGKDGGLSVDEPVAVIEPRGKTTLDIPLSNFTSDEPLVVSEAFYADGTEEGREQVRRWTREDRARAKARREAERGGRKP